ncbi:1-phosphofructokinase [Salipiger aestuarii]|nr:1-phosphofructokinase [Salipiger aestuarii]KAA8606689.1 1-phosphofructokinase [Salipiger aestuarii]KAB2541317.1 1-phosphofructokinase [Salipiger aestuarii]
MTHPSIAAVSLNAAVDQTAFVPGFALDRVNRADATRVDAGGKGVNVASFLAGFGHRVALAGLLGRDNAALFDRHFRTAGVDDRCIRIDGATRTNIKIVDRTGDTVTDLNFPGAPATADDLNAVAATVADLAEAGLDWVACCGSLPDGLGPDTYARLIALARDRGAKVALDTSGPALDQALQARPDIIKPNIDELGALLGRTLVDTDDVIRAARSIVSDGVRLVAVSMGADGAILVTARESVLAVPPSTPVVSTVGCGDAMVAGLIHADTLGLGLADSARLATGFSLGALGQIGPRLPAPDQIESYARAVTVTALETTTEGRIHR